MNTRTARLFPALAAVVGLAACALDAGAAAKIGSPAPDFALEDSKGKTRSLSDFKGKTVVLEWHNHECPYVVKHYQSGNMPKLQAAAAKKGAVWLTIISSAEGNQGYVSGKQADANMKKAGAKPSYVLHDPTGATGRAYGAKTTPHMFVIDKEGVLRYNGAIDSIASTDPDDIPKAESYLGAAVDAVLAGTPVANPSTNPYGCSVKYK